MPGDTSHLKGSSTDNLPMSNAVGGTVQRKVSKMKKENKDESRRYSKRELEKLVGAPAPRSLTDKSVRLWQHAMRPYEGKLPEKPTSPTGADLYRTERKATKKRMRQRRKGN